MKLTLNGLATARLKNPTASDLRATEGVYDAERRGLATRYALAKLRLDTVALIVGAVWLLGLFVSGAFPRILEALGGASASVWANGGFIFLSVTLVTIAQLPLSWWSEFGIEKRFGFSKMTPTMWVSDLLKNLALSAVLGIPILALILKLAKLAGDAWWLWAWAAIALIQWILSMVGPKLILPIFNKFEPLSDGPTRDRLQALANSAGFKFSGIQVMDGSRRSSHSNAFFTGVGRAKTIVLFDTLLDQLNDAELEATVAHEIGHCKRRHLIKLFAMSMASAGLALFLAQWLSKAEWFLPAFGFEVGAIAPTLLLLILLFGAVGVWINLAGNWFSRRCEYEADAYAATTIGDSAPLIQALLRLYTDNLSNPAPHPVYSLFYYSHPTLWERRRHLESLEP